jgi:hypothetical protein
MLTISHLFENDLFVKKFPQVSLIQIPFGTVAADSIVIFQRGPGQARLADCPTQPRFYRTLHPKVKTSMNIDLTF